MKRRVLVVVLMVVSTLMAVVGCAHSVSGAVCQYVLTRQGTFIDVTYSWFETGSLDRERALAQANQAQITDVEVERREALVARRHGGRGVWDTNVVVSRQ